nr:MAG: replication initiator protein [Microvirus sp.]QJB19649.1 MAG: replication initiator protein [Microvirus sp.]
MCTSLRTVWLAREPNLSGKYSRVYRQEDAMFPDRPEYVACGNCMHCRWVRAFENQVRSIHESSLYENSCFITLTYSPENVPKVGNSNVSRLSLRHDDFQDFMKKVRKHNVGMTSLIDPTTDKYIRPIRYSMCGEYGDKTGRPHYHASIFNFNWTDLRQFGWSKGWNKQGKHPLYTSAKLEKLWGHGNVQVCRFTPDTAGYVARYVTKKVIGKQACEDAYQFVDSTTGEVFRQESVYSRASNKRGIGYPWYARYRSDIYPSDFIVYKGNPFRPPKYYDKCFEQEFPDLFYDVKVKRDEKLALKKDIVVNSDFYRSMDAKALLVERKVNQYVRSLDDGF